jgi:hypothetical protein
MSLAIIAVASLAIFLTSPLHGEFLWSESPRNALDGAFVLDLLRDHPFHDPMGWASAYYLKYPSLTILFYPPLLHVVLAVFFAIFGVSQASAMACIAVFMFGLGTGVYALARRIASPFAALSGALLLLAAPELLVWGQQVMLEIPMMALLTWGAFFVLRYNDGGKARDLVVAALLLVAAAYTKQTALFTSLGLAGGLIVAQGSRLWRRKEVWLLAVLVAVLFVPLVLMQMRFGAFNVTSVVSREDIGAPGRFTVAGATWYAVHLPGMMGWPALLLSAALMVICATRPERRLPAADTLMLAGWLGVTYVILSLIDLKETRHGTPLLVPFAIMAAAAIERIVATPALRGAFSLASAALLGYMVWVHPTMGMTGYRDAAELMAELTPPNARVVFAGNQDGAFVFNIRSLESRRDISVIRADKLFLNVSVMTERGLQPRDFSREQIVDMLNRYGVSYVVTIPHVWTEAPVMANFDAVLNSPQFQLVKQIHMTGPLQEKELAVYRNLGPLADPPDPYKIDVPAANLKLAPGVVDLKNGS